MAFIAALRFKDDVCSFPIASMMAESDWAVHLFVRFKNSLAILLLRCSLSLRRFLAVSLPPLFAPLLAFRPAIVLRSYLNLNFASWRRTPS